MALFRGESPETGVAVACGLFGLTRDAWYKALRREDGRQLRHWLVGSEVRRIRADLPGCGGRKLLHLMQGFLGGHGIKLGRDALFDILREEGLLVKRRRRRKLTTNSNHPFRKYANLAAGIRPTAPNQLWVSDITYVATGARFAYLSLVTDAFSRKVVGAELEQSLAASGPVTALRQALGQWDGKGRLCHHSDRGVQYCCHEYTRLLRENKVAISMTQNGDPGENALAERVNGTLKTEFLEYWFHGNFNAAKAAVGKAVRNYNGLRPHESLGYRTPSEVHNG